MRDGQPRVFAFVQVLMPRAAFDAPSRAVAGRLAAAVALAVNPTCPPARTSARGGETAGSATPSATCLKVRGARVMSVE